MLEMVNEFHGVNSDMKLLVVLYLNYPLETWKIYIYIYILNNSKKIILFST